MVDWQKDMMYNGVIRAGNVTGIVFRTGDDQMRGELSVAGNVNIIDIARYAGVSVSTVSRVLNNHPDVSPATKQKVMSIIEKHSYIPNNSARNLRRESLKAVGVIVKGFTNPFFSRMLEIIQSELQTRHYLMLLHQVAPDQDELGAALSLVKEKKLRGLIFLGGNFMQSPDKFAMLDIPLVMATITINEGIDRTAFSSVTIDDYAEAYRVTDRICKAGHKEVCAIGFLPGDRSISRLRIEGFRQALRDNGCRAGGDRLAYAGEFSLSAGYNAAKQLLARLEFTCLFCISDLLALGAIRAVYEAGYRVPQDISVVGFDGLENANYSVPSLATVKQPREKMAHAAVSILMNRIQKSAAHEHLVFEADFQEGESFARLIGNCVSQR